MLAFINSQLQASSIKSLQDKHEQSLDALLSLYGTVRLAVTRHPHVWPMLHNEIAFELLQLGKIDEAKRAASIATSSPLAHAYPEIQETAREIAENERRAILVVPARKQKVIIRFQIVESRARRKVIKPTIGRAPVIRSIIERVATVAPIHAPPFNQ